MGTAHISEDTPQSRDQVAEVLRAYIAHNPTNPYNVINGIEIPCEHVIRVKDAHGKDNVVSIQFRYKINSEKYSLKEMDSSQRNIVLDESSVEILVNGKRVNNPSEVSLTEDGTWKIKFLKVGDNLKPHLQDLQTNFPYKLTGAAYEQLLEGAQFIARFQQDSQRQGNSAAGDDFKHRLLTTSDTQHFQSTLHKLRLQHLSAKLNPAPTAKGDPKFGTTRHELLKNLSLRGVSWNRVGSSDLTLDYPIAKSSLILRARYSSDSHTAKDEFEASSSLALRSVSVLDPKTGSESYLTDKIPYAAELDQMSSLALNFNNLDYSLRLQLSELDSISFPLHPIIRGDLLKTLRNDLAIMSAIEAPLMPRRPIHNIWEPAAIQDDIRHLPNPDKLALYMKTLSVGATTNSVGAYVIRFGVFIVTIRQIFNMLFKISADKTMHQELDGEVTLETEIDKEKVKFTVSRTEQEDILKVKKEDAHYFDNFKKHVVAPRIFVEQLLDNDTRVGYYARISRNTKNPDDVYLQIQLPTAPKTHEAAPRYDD